MAKQYVFTKDIAGSNNGIDVVEYKQNQIIEVEQLSEALFIAWYTAGVIKELPVGKDVEEFLDGETNELPEGATEVSEDEVKELAEDAGAEENDNAGTNTPEDDKNSTEEQADNAELTDEKKGELVYQAKEILELPEGAKLTDEDIAKLKEIGIELKIAGMFTSQKPQTILDKINAYIDEYDNVGEDIPEEEK